MSLQQAYLIEIQRETENTRKMLQGIEDRHLSFKPHEKSMSLKTLAAHIVELHNWVSIALSTNEFNFLTDYTRPDPTGIQDIRDMLNDSYEKNAAQINAMTEDDWFSEWILRAGDHIIAKMPKVGTMRFIIQNHLIHHRGQLSVYLRLNDIPVPGLYGPSADDAQ